MTICPIQNIEPSAETIAIEGKTFRIYRLPVDNYEEHLIRKLNKEDLSFAKKLSKHPEEKQREMIHQKMERDRRNKRCNELGLAGKARRLSKAEMEKITPTGLEIEDELQRLTDLIETK